MLRESDVVIITCSLNESTKNLFGSAQFAMMKPSAILINTSRGGKRNTLNIQAFLFPTPKSTLFLS